MDKIEIIKNPYGDTRTADPNVTFEEFQDANDSHIADVYNVMKAIAEKIETAGANHDNTKKSKERMFFDDFKYSMENKVPFIDGKWWHYHVENERHHLLARCPDDVNLIDIMEMLVDCVCAALTRKGTFSPVELPSEMLQKAVKNTTDLIQDMVKVVDPAK